jgi:thioester reductase-like protein
VIPYGTRDAAETDTLEDIWTKLTDGYAQTKWVAEQLVARSQRRGLPAIIYRMGWYLWASHSLP